MPISRVREHARIHRVHGVKHRSDGHRSRQKSAQPLDGLRGLSLRFVVTRPRHAPRAATACPLRSVGPDSCGRPHRPDVRTRIHVAVEDRPAFIRIHPDLGVKRALLSVSSADHRQLRRPGLEPVADVEIGESVRQPFAQDNLAFAGNEPAAGDFLSVRSRPGINFTCGRNSIPRGQCASRHWLRRCSSLCGAGSSGRRCPPRSAAGRSSRARSPARIGSP